MGDDVTTGTLVGQRYRLEHQVGQGGMGAVWVAEDEKLQRWVAVKLLGAHCARSRSATERFEREAMALARLRSPHVVQVFDYGTGEAGAYMVMELLNGVDLYSWIRKNRPAPLSVVTDIICQAAKGLGAIHRAGIVHRDLKPSNVFVVRDHDENIIKIFDFGLAKGLQELGPLRDRTGEGVLLGTPRYMSPEQAHGAREVDHRSDLWSLAVIAYLAITGQLPFRGKGVGEVITKISTETPRRPSELVRGVGAEVDAFFARGLAKDPADRFQTARELGDELQRLCSPADTSAELVPLYDQDTMLDEAELDTHVSVLPSGGGNTLRDLTPFEPAALPDVPADAGAGDADATVDESEPTVSDEPDSFALAPTRPLPPSSRAPRSPSATASIVAATVIVAAVALYELRPRSTSKVLFAGLVPVAGPRVEPSATAPPPRVSASAPPASEASSAVRPITHHPAPSASTSSDAGRGLEHFRDRH